MPGARWQEELARRARARRASARCSSGPRDLGAWEQPGGRRRARPRGEGSPTSGSSWCCCPGCPSRSTRRAVAVPAPAHVGRLPRAGSTTSAPSRRSSARSRACRSGPAVPIEPRDDVCPYRGLEAFDEEHAELFFGREADVQRLLEKLKARRFLAVLGAVRQRQVVARPRRPGAGAAARRAAGSESWRIVILRPGARPLEALAAQLAAPRRRRRDAGARSTSSPPTRARCTSRRRSRSPTRPPARACCWWSTSSRRCSRSAATRTSARASSRTCSTPPPSPAAAAVVVLDDARRLLPPLRRLPGAGRSSSPRTSTSSARCSRDGLRAGDRGAGAPRRARVRAGPGGHDPRRRRRRSPARCRCSSTRCSSSGSAAAGACSRSRATGRPAASQGALAQRADERLRRRSTPEQQRARAAHAPAPHRSPARAPRTRAGARRWPSSTRRSDDARRRCCAALVDARLLTTSRRRDVGDERGRGRPRGADPRLAAAARLDRRGPRRACASTAGSPRPHAEWERLGRDASAALPRRAAGRGARVARCERGRAQPARARVPRREPTAERAELDRERRRTRRLRGLVVALAVLLARRDRRDGLRAPADRRSAGAARPRRRPEPRSRTRAHWSASR